VNHGTHGRSTRIEPLTCAQVSVGANTLLPKLTASGRAVHAGDVGSDAVTGKAAACWRSATRGWGKRAAVRGGILADLHGLRRLVRLLGRALMERAWVAALRERRYSSGQSRGVRQFVDRCILPLGLLYLSLGMSWSPRAPATPSDDAVVPWRRERECTPCPRPWPRRCPRPSPRSSPVLCPALIRLPPHAFQIEWAEHQAPSRDCKGKVRISSARSKRQCAAHVRSPVSRLPHGLGIPMALRARPDGTAGIFTPAPTSKQTDRLPQGSSNGQAADSRWWRVNSVLPVARHPKGSQTPTDTSRRRACLDAPTNARHGCA
jgi:hypothetical protein